MKAGWSSPVAREPHKLEVVGSNPTPAPIAVFRLFAYTALPLLAVMVTGGICR